MRRSLPRRSPPLPRPPDIDREIVVGVCLSFAASGRATIIRVSNWILDGEAS